MDPNPMNPEKDMSETSAILKKAIRSLKNSMDSKEDPRVKSIVLTKVQEAYLWSLQVYDTLPEIQK